MVTLEQVEKLRERADVSFEEAKTALEQTDGDILDALILLERQGKTNPPPSGGYYSGESKTEAEPDYGTDNTGNCRQHTTFGDVMRAVGAFLLKVVNAGNVNYIDAYRNGNVILSCPVTVFVILLVVAFWVTIPLLFLGLIFGWRYKLRGPNLGRDSINEAIANAESVVEDIKNSVVESAANAKAEHEAKKAGTKTED